MVSASGDASLRLIYGKDVQPVDPSKIPDFKNFNKAFQSPPNNTVGGKHYGISLQWGPNMLIYNTQKVKPAPTSWCVDLHLEVQGQGHGARQPDPDRGRGAVPDEDAQPSLGIKDPYELNSTQFNAAISLLKKQKPLIKRYWPSGGQEISDFKNGNVVIGAAWPYQLSPLIAREGARQGRDPEGGRNGLARHLDGLGAHEEPRLRLQVARLHLHAEGAGTAGHLLRRDAGQLEGVPDHEQARQGRRARSTTLNAPLQYFKQIYFWKTPLADCGNGKKNCMDYTKWQQAWTQLKG